MTPETQIKKDIIDYLDSLGPQCWHVAYHNMGYGKRGVPDRLVCYRGQFLAIEVKSGPDKKPTKWQERCLQEIRVAGGWRVVAYNVEQVKHVIALIDRSLATIVKCSKCTKFHYEDMPCP